MTKNGKCYKFADVISFNAYPAWYIKPMDLDYIAVYWKDVFDWSQSSFPQKPVFVSECGAGAVYEWKNETAV